MEDRKSVLETTKPSDAIGRLTARQHRHHSLVVVLGVVLLFVVVGLVGLMFFRASQGTQGIEVPAVGT